MRTSLPTTAASVLTALVVLAGCASELTRPPSEPATVRSDVGAAAAELSPGVWSPWSEPVSVEGINTLALEARPALSKDGLSLYFQSNREGGIGANDIWVSRRACLECPFPAAVNLGAAVNTAANEAGPALSRDGHWLFFNSNRPGGHGGGDIWVSYRQDVDDDFGWGAPENLGPGVNSSGGDTQASYFENEGGAPQLFFVRAVTPGMPTIQMSTLALDGTWGTAAAVDGMADFNGPSIHPNGLEIYLFETFANHRIWHATRESPDAPWSAPVELGELTPGVASVFHPFIHAHGGTETLFMVGVPTVPDNDIYVSTRTRGAMRP